MKINKINSSKSFKAAMLVTGHPRDIAEISSILSEKADIKKIFDYQSLLLNTNKKHTVRSILFTTDYDSERLQDFKHDAFNVPRVGKNPIRLKQFFDKNVHKYIPKIRKYSAQDVLEAIKDYAFNFNKLLVTEDSVYF